MCDVSLKLIAWMDRELPAEEAAEIARHVERCSECRGSVTAFRRASAELDAHCDDVWASQSSTRPALWPALIAAAGAAVSLILLFLIWQGHRVPSPAPSIAQASIAASPVDRGTDLPPSNSADQKIHRKRAAKPPHKEIETDSASSQNQTAGLAGDEPVIQISIPAEEIFPPGAVPEGMRFFADLTVAADGSAERLRVRPRLVGFERGTTQP